MSAYYVPLLCYVDMGSCLLLGLLCLPIMPAGSSCSRLHVDSTLHEAHQPTHDELTRAVLLSFWPARQFLSGRCAHSRRRRSAWTACP